MTRWPCDVEKGGGVRACVRERNESVCVSLFVCVCVWVSEIMTKKLTPHPKYE